MGQWGLPRWWGIAVCLAALSGCRAPAPTAPESAFHNLQRVSISNGEALPAGQLRLNAYVVDVGGTTDGTYLVMSDSPRSSDRMILVYGSSADSLFAQYLKGQRVEIDFAVTGRTQLPDGSAALHVNLTGMRAVASTPATPASRVP